MFEDRVLKVAGIGVQSELDRSDPAYAVCTRIVDDISSVSPSEAQWKIGDPKGEAIAEIRRRIDEALSALKAEAKAEVEVEKPKQRTRRNT